MNVWTGLLKKEFRLSRARYLVGLIIVAVLFSFAYFTAIRINEPGVIIVFSSMIIMFHMFYLPIHLFSSLNTEGKQLQLWLHNPQSGVKLLSAKLFVSFIAMLVSLAISILVTYLLLNQSYYDGVNFYKDLIAQLNIRGATVLQLGTFAVAHIIIFSLYIAITIIFLWTAFQTSKSRVGKLSWIVLGVLLTVPNWILSKFQETEVYAWMTNWGKIDLPFLERLHWETSAAGYGDFLMYAGDYLFHLLITAALFFLSAWLIDKKMEV